MSEHENALLEHAKDILGISYPVAFSYDRDTRTFSVGTETMGIDEIGLYGLDYRRDDMLSSDAVDVLFENEPLVHTYKEPISLPRFNQFIQSQWSDSLKSEVIEVMADIMPVSEVLRRSSRDHLGFNAAKIDRELGRIVLQVPGTCACIGPDATVPTWGSRLWDEQVFHFSLHNIEAPIQRAALLGGLGHLALLAR